MPRAGRRNGIVAEDGVLIVGRRGTELGRWTLSVVPDAPPLVAWSEPPGASRGQRRLQTAVTLDGGRRLRPSLHYRRNCG